jgi:hypothetical protein
VQYVVVEFDDDAEAGAFAATLGEGSDASVRIVGLYKKPSKFCECAAPSEKSVMGTKYGWWVCKVCFRPQKGVWQVPRNLLREGEQPGKRQYMFSSVEPRL